MRRWCSILTGTDPQQIKPTFLLPAAKRDAKRLFDNHNSDAAYVHPAVSPGVLDFSDTVEVAYVFGFDDMSGVEDFVEGFASEE